MLDKQLYQEVDMGEVQKDVVEYDEEVDVGV